MLRGTLASFLPSKQNQSLAPAFFAFCTAGVGVALGFIADAKNWHWLSIAAFALTALGILGVWIAIGFHIWRVLTRRQ
jgi:hypothetical protein